jgi:hypothetical protein
MLGDGAWLFVLGLSALAFESLIIALWAGAPWPILFGLAILGLIWFHISWEFCEEASGPEVKP